MKMKDKNDGRARRCRRTNRVLTVCKFLNPKHLNIAYCAYGFIHSFIIFNSRCIIFIPACAQVGRLSPLYFNLWHFSNRSRQQRSNAKSTQSIQPQTFYVLLFHVLRFHVLHFHVLSFGPSFSCPANAAISCPAHWSVNFTSVIFTSSIFSAPETSSESYRCGWSQLVNGGVVAGEQVSFQVSSASDNVLTSTHSRSRSGSATSGDRDLELRWTGRR